MRRPPSPPERDAAGGAVGELDADRAHVGVVEHRPLVLGAGADQPGAAEGERREGGLEQDPLRLPLVEVVALHHALPAAHLLRVAGADPAGGVDVEVGADRAVAEAGAHAAAPACRRRRRRARPRAARAHGEGGRRAAVLAAGAALDADRAAALDQDPAHLDPGPQPRPGGDRPRQVADVHPALGVDRAAERAGAALHAVAGVAGDRAAADPERRRALHRQLSVAAHPLRVERRARGASPRPRRSRHRGRAPSRSRSARPSPRAPPPGRGSRCPS